jgi:lipooligosaccharide transport system permease protein
MVQIVLLPMFLFSATFFPISVYPVAIQWFVRVSPLYHSITLIRALTLGSVGWINLLNAIYLVVLGLVGIAVARRRMAGLLLT